MMNAKKGEYYTMGIKEKIKHLSQEIGFGHQVIQQSFGYSKGVIYQVSPSNKLDSLTEDALNVLADEEEMNHLFNMASKIPIHKRAIFASMLLRKLKPSTSN